MAIKEQVNVLLNKKMDRQEFVKHVAIGLVAMTGASSVLRSLTPKHKSAGSAYGYGASAYGGSPALKNQG
ncbi:hypothetical protein KDA14_04580 [Candidatus Saccharibacteria bacterium]|nr:hypothetical protein [Candidatus Saccharibacteria bacterium]